MTKKTTSLIFALIISIQDCATASGAPLPAHFVVRTPTSSVMEFKQALTESALTSFIDWSLLEAKNSFVQPSELDSALELTLTRPQEAYAALDHIVTDLQARLLAAESRELVLSILIKMSELAVAKKLQVSALQRGQNLILAHKSFREVPSYRQAILNRDTKTRGLRSLDGKQFSAFMNQIRKTRGLEEALVILNGEIVGDTKNYVPPAGTQQWALLSNSFLPILKTSTWQDFSSRIFSDPQSLKPMAQGSCGHSQILADDFQVQTQGVIFVSERCFSSKDFAGASLPTSMLPGSAHLSQLPQIQEEPTKTRNILLLTGLVVVAGLAYSLKDKSISFKAPGR